MNYTISNICFLYDAKLYILFDHYLDTLEPDAVEAAVAEQVSWLEARADSVSIAASEYEGGSLSPYVAGMEYIEVTKNRIADLEEAMAGVSPKTLKSPRGTRCRATWKVRFRGA